ncbi:MAG: hypothetical protein ABI718_06915 [Acidobacteriota bacterium]
MKYTRGSMRKAVVVLLLCIPATCLTAIGMAAAGPVPLTTPTPSPCAAIDPPQPFAPAQVTSGTSYRLKWDPVPGASQYEVDESLTPDFNSPPQRTVTGNSVEFTHFASDVPVSYYYQVRGVSSCNGSRVSFATPNRVLVIPQPDPAAPPPGGVSVSVPDDQSTPVTFSFILFPPEGVSSAPFTATTDEEFFSVSPSSGTVTSAGTLLTVTGFVAGLPVGTNSGEIRINFAPSAKRTGPLGNTFASVPVSISLVSPVAPVAKTPLPPDNTLIVPAIAHVDGISTKFVSDVRIANTSSQALRYELTFTPTQTNGTKVGTKTQFTIQPGATTALDDIVRNWYGVGQFDNGNKGSLEIKPLNFSGKTGENASAFATVGSSRTFSNTGEGTFGQFIPVLPFGDFIGKTTDPLHPKILSLQQVAQSAEYRTNVGLVEAAGQPATVELSVFNTAGEKLGTFTETLQPGEHRQMNQYLASKGIALGDGRIEVKVTSETGRVSTYASVIDNVTSDPQLVTAANLSQVNERLYVVPGLADLRNPLANWRSDLRLFNASKDAQTATLTFYPQGAPESPVSRELTIAPGETKALDNVLQTVFGVESATGAVHVETIDPSSMVITAKTYDQLDSGTFGQFIPAVTLGQTIGVGDRSLQVLQIEQSDRFRTNVGLAEATGQPVRVQLTALLPRTSSAPSITVDLAANEFRQLNNVLATMGIEHAYNVRLTVKAISGQGRITAYASVIDNNTQDPTFVPGQ